VARSIDLTPNALAVRYSGADALLRGRRRLIVPHVAIRSVRIGFTDVPAAFALRIGLSTAPLGKSRRGTFWWNGKRMFLDFANPERAVVLELGDEQDALVAIEPDTPPDDLAAALRERSGAD
jgi:hypothetical protein